MRTSVSPADSFREEEGPKGALSGLRVLLADDHASVRLAIGRLLRLEGASVTLASDGCEVAEAALAAEFDLILMDLRMPRMTGIDATATLRARGCRVPVVAITADLTAEDRAAALAAGCTAVLGKPFGLADLVALLRASGVVA